MLYTMAFTSRGLSKLAPSLASFIPPTTENDMRGLPGTNIISAIVILAKCKTGSECTQILASATSL